MVKNQNVMPNLEPQSEFWTAQPLSQPLKLHSRGSKSIYRHKNSLNYLICMYSFCRKGSNEPHWLPLGLPLKTNTDPKIQG